MKDGYWFVKDLGSKNGIKVNGVRCQESRLDPGDTLSVAKHVYEIKYSPSDLGAIGPPPADKDLPDAIFKQSLLERAGLATATDSLCRSRSQAVRRDEQRSRPNSRSQPAGVRSELLAVSD